MRRSLWLVAALGALFAVGLTLVAIPRAPEWTTSSPEALAEFEAGQAELKKFYFAEGRRSSPVTPPAVPAPGR
jgi:hypothetical protein